MKSIFKKVSAFLLVGGLIGGLHFQNKAGAFFDVPETRPEFTAITYLNELSILMGRGNSDRFDPDGLLNRAEWPVIMSREIGVEPVESEYGFCFPDVSNQWFAPFVCYAKDNNWVKGYQAGLEAGKYIPTNPLSLAEILVMLERRFDWPTEDGEQWFSGAYNYAFNANLITPGTPVDHLVTRAEASEILFRALAIRKYNVSKYDPLLADIILQNSSEDSENQNEEPQNLPQVTLKPFEDQPANASVARGATYVPVVRFLLESDEQITLDQFSIRRVSVGRTEDIAYARIMANGRILEEKTFSGERNSVVWRSLNFVLEAHQPILFEMNIDFEPTAQPQLAYQFEISSENFEFNKAVNISSAEFSGEVFRTTGIDAAQVSISNPTRALKLPFVESEGEVIGRFDITAGEHDLLIKRIRLEDAEDVNERDFFNFRLTVGSQQVGFAEHIKRNVLDFIVDDYLLDAGRTRTFTVRADIADARIADAIRLYMDEAQHLYAYDFEFGYGVQVNNQFGRDQAWCVGSEGVECPVEGLRKRCSKDDIEFGVRDCEEEDPSSQFPQECDDRLAPVCGKVSDEASETFTNRCQAEKAGATNILPGPCEGN